MVQTLSKKSDSQIQREVLDELRWDTRIEETDVGVEVDNGVVTLTGTVNSYAKRLAAEEAAHAVVGVLDVANDIQVKFPGGFERTDTDIAQAVRNALRWDVYVPDQQVETTVSKGWVTLAGTVDLLRQSWEAENAVRNLTGVKGVINKLQVKEARVNMEEVHRRIEQALERRAEREAEKIEVSLDRGEVTLSGRVHSWAERSAIVGAVRHAPGVKAVKANLTIDPYS